MKINKTIIRKSSFLLLAMIIATAGAVIAQGLIPSSDGTIYGCYLTHANDNEHQGQLRVVSNPDDCKDNETAIQWSEIGPQGPQGPPGDQFLFGQSCPEETYMTGITANGYIICNEIPTTPNICGNGVLEAPYEECEDGNTDNGDGCSSDCLVELPPYVCGNGVLEEPYEDCDDGNNLNGDGCSYDCKNELSCGPGESACFGSYCTDLNNDPANCGGCGNPCMEGSVCIESSCVFVNPPFVSAANPNPLPNGCGDLYIDGTSFLSNTSVQISGQSTNATVEPAVTFINSNQLIATIDCVDPLPVDLYDVCVSSGPWLTNCETALVEVQ